MEFFDSVEGGENAHGEGDFRGLEKEETVCELLSAKNLHFVKDKGQLLEVISHRIKWGFRGPRYKLLVFFSSLLAEKLK